MTFESDFRTGFCVLGKNGDFSISELGAALAYKAYERTLEAEGVTSNFEENITDLLVDLLKLGLNQRVNPITLLRRCETHLRAELEDCTMQPILEGEETLEDWLSILTERQGDWPF